MEGEAVLLARTGGRVHAVGATCTHLGGPLAEGVLVDGEVRCPWHHARFALATGEAVGAPAFDPLPCFAVEERGGRVFVTGRRPRPERPRPAAEPPARVVILGGGARLRRDAGAGASRRSTSSGARSWARAARATASTRW